jgi:IS30 family transposase
MSGIAMGQRYSHLTLEERCRLRGLMEMGVGKSEIARRLGRHRSTIDRELRRNRCAESYRPDSAARRAWARKLRGSRIVRSTRLRAHVEDRLAMGWSPEQIAGRMELDGSEHRVSAESIYRHAYSAAGRCAGLPRLLAQRKPKRGRRRRNGREPAIPNRVPIHQRPTKAHLRSQFGHWEGDLMHFRRRRDILLTLQERRSRLTLARRIRSKDADVTARAIATELGGLPAKARRTITHDNGGEFARHEAATEAIGLRAYFCDPHSPWQRGGLENANGLLRRDLPRRTSLDDHTDADIDDLVWNLNATPRKCLGYRTPIEAFAVNLGVALEM